MYQADDEESRLQRAEMFRELELFDESIAFLATPFPASLGTYGALDKG